MDLGVDDVALRLITVLMMVCANAFFVASEFALVTVRKTRIDQLVAEVSGFARRVQRALTSPDKYLAAAQLGITMSSLALGWVGESALAHLVEPFFLWLPETARGIPSVPLGTPAGRLLALMRQAMTHHAIVIDEYGGTAGLVTFDDLMERIVGKAGGREDLKAQRMTKLADGSAMIDGLMLVADVNERFGLHIDKQLYTTVGGYVLDRIGRRPSIGDRVEVEGCELRVEAVDGLRVAWIHLAPAPPDRG